MIDLSDAATVAACGAVLLCGMRILASSTDEYERGYEDGKEYAIEILMGSDHGEGLEEFVRWKDEHEQHEA